MPRAASLRISASLRESVPASGSSAPSESLGTVRVTLSELSPPLLATERTVSMRSLLEAFLARNALAPRPRSSRTRRGSAKTVTITTFGGEGAASRRLGAHHGHLHVQYHHVRARLLRQGHRPQAVRGLLDHLDVALEGEHLGHALAHHGVVVGQEHPDGLAGSPARGVPRWVPRAHRRPTGGRPTGGRLTGSRRGRGPYPFSAWAPAGVSPWPAPAAGAPRRWSRASAGRRRRRCPRGARPARAWTRGLCPRSGRRRPRSPRRGPKPSP